MNLLHTIGLMTRAEHEAASFRIECQAAEALNEVEYLKAELRAADNLASGWEAKFKRAVTDLAAQAEEIAALKKEIADFVRDADHDNDTIEGMRSEIKALRPDAEAMRKKRAADRKRMAGKRNG